MDRIFAHRFSDVREASGHHRLPPGRYVIIPTTYQPNTECEFVIRIFAEKQHLMQYELSYLHFASHTSKTDVWLYSYYKYSVRVLVCTVH